MREPTPREPTQPKAARFAIEDLADVTESAIKQVIGDWLKPRLCRNNISSDGIIGDRKVTKKPTPGWSLVISTIALKHSSARCVRAVLMVLDWLYQPSVLYHSLSGYPL